MRAFCLLATGLALLVVAVPASADTITLNTPVGGPFARTATLSDAVAGYGHTAGQGQPVTDDLEAYFSSPDEWTRVGDKNSSNGPNGAYDFDVVLTAGNWTQNNVAGEWSFDSSIWSDHGQVVITMHVGGDPEEDSPDDHFAWMITEGTTFGRFSYDRLSDGGGGFSNMQVWVRGVGNGNHDPMPEPATGLLLLGALLGCAGLRRRRRAS